MLRLSVSWVVTLAVGSFGIQAQCPPANNHEGFHQQNVGHALAAQGDEALFGHLSGYHAPFHERRGGDHWQRTAFIGGSGSHPVRMGYTVALRGDIAARRERPKDAQAHYRAAVLADPHDCVPRASLALMAAQGHRAPKAGAPRWP